MSPVELKRQARNRDPKASAVYKLAANQAGLDLLLILLGAASAVAIIIISTRNSWWMATLSILLIFGLAFWAPKADERGFLWSFTAWASPYIFKLTQSFVPVLNRLASSIPGSSKINLVSDIYEKDDLVSLLNAQAHQPSNRIPEQDLQIAVNALNFGDKKVVDVMAPRRKARFVSEDESVGPMLMDELHATGYTIFPVVKAASKPADPEIIGMLYLDDLIANPDKPKVKDVVHPGKDFINEDEDLRTALERFIKTKKHLLVVTNKFEEVVGVITFDTVVEQIIGKKLPEQELI